MSNIKRSLPEDFDVTDPKDQSGAVMVGEPTVADFALKDLWFAVKAIEKNANKLGLGDLEELYHAKKTLDRVIKSIEIPF